MTIHFTPLVFEADTFIMLTTIIVIISSPFSPILSPLSSSSHRALLVILSLCDSPALCIIISIHGLPDWQRYWFPILPLERIVSIHSQEYTQELPSCICPPKGHQKSLESWNINGNVWWSFKKKEMARTRLPMDSWTLFVGRNASKYVASFASIHVYMYMYHHKGKPAVCTAQQPEIYSEREPGWQGRAKYTPT